VTKSEHQISSIMNVAIEI